MGLRDEASAADMAFIRLWNLFKGERDLQGTNY